MRPITLILMSKKKGIAREMQCDRWVSVHEKIRRSLSRGEARKCSEAKAVSLSPQINPEGQSFEDNSQPSRLPLVQFVLERDVLGAVGAVVVREAAARHRHVLAHVDAPGVVAVARQQSARAHFHAVGPAGMRGQPHFAPATGCTTGIVLPDVVVVVAVVPGIRVRAHVGVCGTGVKEGSGSRKMSGDCRWICVLVNVYICRC